MPAIPARWSLLLVLVIGAVIASLLAVPDSSEAGPGGPFAYVANRSSGRVAVIDLVSETEVASIVTGGSPYWVAISANGDTVAASLKTSGVALIDGTTNSLIGVVTGVGTEPEAVAVNSTGTTVYVADESGDDLYVVDVGTETVTSGPTDISGCSEPENMVISPNDAFLYVTCAGSSVVRVATAGFAMLTIDTGLSDPHGIALNPAGTRLYYTDGTDVLEWNTGTQSLTGTTFSSCDMYFGAVSPDGSRLFCKKENSFLNVYNTSDGSLVNSINTGGTAVGVRGDGARAYVPNGSATEVIDTATVTDLPGNITMTGSGGRGIAVGPGGLPTPTPSPSPTPSATPTPSPTPTPTPPPSSPTPPPTATATATPTAEPTPSPTTPPTSAPTAAPTLTPTPTPTPTPSPAASATPSPTPPLAPVALPPTGGDPGPSSVEPIVLGLGLAVFLLGSWLVFRGRTAGAWRED